MKKLNLILLFLFALTLMSFAQLTKKELRLQEKNWHRQFPQKIDNKTNLSKIMQKLFFTFVFLIHLFIVSFAQWQQINIDDSDCINCNEQNKQYLRYSNKCVKKTYKKDRIEQGILSFDKDSVFVINYDECDIQSVVKFPRILSSCKYDFDNRNFENTDKASVTRILINKQQTIFSNNFIEDLPFRSDEYPNLKEIQFYGYFPKPDSLVMFKKLQSIAYVGSQNTVINYFRVPCELTKMENLRRLILCNAYMDFPDYIKDFPNLEMLFLCDNKVWYSELNVLSIKTLRFLYCEGRDMFFYQPLIQNVANDAGDGFACYGNFFLQSEVLHPNYPHGIVNENRFNADTSYFLYVTPIDDDEQKILVKGMSVNGVPTGVWYLEGKTMDFSNGFSVSKLDKHYIETDGFIFYMDKYCRQCYDLYDDKGRLLAAYDNGKFWGEMSYKDTLDEFIQKFDIKN
ncbi:MAG: hypothetical protein IKP08_05510 [Bacteroidales bacterium]|nr:hypothetical protein [Bacteroidales bacterium]